MQSLEDPRIKNIVEKLSYTRYVSEQRETETVERYYEIVDQLLEKLPEKERTVVTLHYLDEMTTKEIGNLLRVSVNTIHSWLYRARERLREHLQGEELHMTQEGREELDQSTEELILKEFVTKILGTIETKIHAELQGQLGKSIPDTQMLKQVSEKLMGDIKEKILAEIQAQTGKESSRT